MRALRDALADLPDAVHADLLESGAAYLLVVDVPGATPEGTSVRSAGRTIHVSVDRADDPPDEFEYRRRERAATLELEVPVPPDATGEAATANVERGVLELELPKAGTDETEIPVE